MENNRYPGSPSPLPQAGNPNGRHSQRRTQAVNGTRGPLRTSQSNGLLPKILIRDVLLIEAGEDVLERAGCCFQDEIPFCFRDFNQMGIVLSASGTVLNPTIYMQDSASMYEGACDIITLSGSFTIPRNGPVDLTGRLEIAIRTPEGTEKGGTVVGPMIAANRVQIALACFIHED